MKLSQRLVLVTQNKVDFVDIVVAPVLVGGKETSTLIDGASFMCTDELSRLGVLKLLCTEVLDGSYLRLKYQVIR